MKVLWRKTLGMLIRFPSLLATVLVVTAITAVTAVAGPAFLSSTERGSLSQGIDQAGRWTAGLRIVYPTLVFDHRSTAVLPNQQDFQSESAAEAVARYYAFIDRMMPALADRMRDVEFVHGPEMTLGGNALDATGPEGDATVRVIHRTDAFQNVTLLEGGGNDGVWLADVTAENLGVEVGDRVRLQGENGRMRVPVAAIYRYLPDEEPTDYWNPLGAFIYRAPDAFTDPPAFVLAGRSTHEDLMAGLKDWGSISFAFPLTGKEMSLDEALALDDEFEGLGSELLAAGGPLGRAQGEVSLNTTFVGGGDAADSVLPGIVRSAEDRIEAVTPVVDLVSLAARLVAFAVMAAAGFFLVKKRRVEAASLAARGVGPLPQALRYGSEAVLPALIGTLAGAVLGFQLVALIGPAEDLGPEVIASAGGLIASSFVIGLFLLVGAAGLSVLREERSIAEMPPPLTGFHGLLVASGVAVVGGAAAYLMRGSISAGDLESIRDPRLTLMPVILILAGATIGAALLRAVLPHVARVMRYRSHALYLAAKRLSGASGMTQVLVTASACSLGIAIYGFSVSSSISDATESKAQLFVGSDFSAQVTSSFDPPDMDFPTTHVTTFDRAKLSEDRFISLMVVDPDTFATTAYWRDSFADASLEDLLGSIDGEPGGPIEVLVTQDLGPDPQVTSGSVSADLDVTGVVRFFPGMSADDATAIMTRDSFEEAIGTVGTLASRRDMLWANGEPDDIGTALLRERLLFSSPITVATALGSPTLQSLLWILGLLSALGAVAGAISVFGLLLYLQARHRASLVSSALTRRMGLGRGHELLSWGAEIGGALVTSFAVAVGVGLAVAATMKDLLDPRPGLPPDPLLTVPAVSLVLLALALAVTAAWTARRLQTSVDRADIAEVLRT